MVDCGGSLTTYGDKDWDSLTDKNIANKSYQSCYEEKGFRSSSYWSSTTVLGGENNAWGVDFNDGNANWSNKSNGNYVRCVRAGQ